MDKRNLRSKKTIKDALILLSSKKAFIDISVHDLCREAGISRSTFYNNYHSLNDVVAEISSEYMEKIRGKNLNREFFESLTRDGNELKLLVETGVFGREFSFYLKDLMAGDNSKAERGTRDDVLLNIKTLYHAFGVFGVLQNLSRMYGSNYYEAFRAETIDTLMELSGTMSKE
jgi:AcrR family transcriptional regulator